jgi:hypothetical protein
MRLRSIRAWSAVGVVLLVLSLTVRAQAPLERKTALDGKVSLLVPTDFTVMSEELLQRKYPTANRPSLVYTNAKTTINIALDHKALRLAEDQLGAALESVKSTFKSSYPTAVWFRSEIKPINGRQFFLVDVRTPAIDTEVRNILAGTSFEGRLLIVSFNATKALEAEWLPVGNKIIESITLK